MPLVDNAWYINYGNGSSTGYYAVAAWAASAAKVCGNLVRQLTAPAVGSERVFVCIASTGGTGTTGGSEPTWVVTRGAKNTDNTVTWQEATGVAALNGDLTNTPKWTDVNIKGQAIVLGQVIQNAAGTLILICTTAGTAGSGAEPSWSAYTTAGATTADNTVTWTTLGASFSVLAAPHARLANAFAVNWGQAGNNFFVADNHAETQATALTLTTPVGAGANTNVQIYSFDHTLGSLPPTAPNTGASVTTTGNSNLTVGGSGYFYGLTFNCGTGANANTITLGSVGQNTQVFENCQFAKVSTNSNNAAIGFPTGNSTEVIFRNTTVKFGSTADAFTVRGTFRWENTISAIQGATIPTTLFDASGFLGTGILDVRGVDFSALGSGGTVVGATAATLKATLIDCKLASGWALASNVMFNAGSTTDFIRCDGGATNYITVRNAPCGNHLTETTIVRTGGATDGTTPVSWKIVTGPAAVWARPFLTMPIAIWNDTTGSSVTATVYGIWGGGAVPNNDDIWIEAEYLGSSATPQGSFASNTKANGLAVGTALPSDGSTWSGSTTKFKMSVTFTPQMKGPINLVVKAAKPSSTFYIDPLIVLS